MNNLNLDRWRQWLRSETLDC